ncbi:hypothetical protein L7F22_000829 [Adiantum nelumboides]|nr:hypothetical protein [Adiantum nelumboides]
MTLYRAVVLLLAMQGSKRLSRRIVQEGQHFKGSSRGASKKGIQQFKDEADSGAEGSLQVSKKQHNQKRGASHDLDNLYESQSDDMEYIDKLDAVMDESDMDSDDGDARIITPDDIFRGIEQESYNKLPEKEQDKARKKMMDQLISAALDETDEAEDGPVPEDEQHSLRVGIIGAVNAGKSTLTNLMVGTKVAAVSRKRNTTLSEILGIVTIGKYQILLYDTPGLVLDILGKPSKTDTRSRSESAWQLFSHCEVLLVLVDAYRQIHK